MSEYTPITGELRNSMTYDITTAPNGVRTASIDSSAFCDLCDAIDSVHAALEAEHEKAMIRAGQLLDDAEKERDYNYANWQECKQKVLQGNITFEELERENESLKAKLDRARGEWDYWESTRVELPKDADGVPIRIGDVMDFSKNVRNLTVLGIGMVDESECNWGVFVREGRDYVWYNAKFLRHHKPDTWASIIEDAIGDRIEDRAEFDKELDALVARCKALAGEDE